jgi:hypothetical protein
VLTAAIAIVFGAWTLRSGIHQAVDTPTYSRWADLLIEAGFNFSRYLREQQFVAPPLMYLSWITVVAAAKSTLGASWMAGIVALNWIALAAGAYATLAAVRVTTRSAAGVWLGAALFIVCGDLLIFVPYVLSDLMFFGLSTLVLAAAIALAVDDVADSGGRAGSPMRLIVGGSIIAVVALTFRPVAIPLLFIWVIAIGMRAMPALAARLAVPIVAISAIGLAAAIIGHAYLVQNPALWPGSPPAMLQMVSTEYHSGILVHQADIVVTPPAAVSGFVMMTLDKLLFFLTPWLPFYSASHQAINLLFFVPAYGLSLLGLRNFGRLSAAQQRVAVLLVLFVAFVSAFHAMSLIDSDHRYRLPLVPAFIILAAVGLESARRPQTLAATARMK